MSRTRIAIIGGGFSGATLAARLLRTCSSPIEVLLIEKTGRFAAGLAYSTDDPRHLLNVPADKMSATEDDPAHFLNWLTNSRIDPDERTPGDFVSRRTYRRYLQDNLDQAAAQPGHPESKLTKIHDEAIAVTATQGQVKIAIISDGSVYVDYLVLATGYLAETSIACHSLCRPAFQLDPDAVKAAREIVLIGSGLTAVDMALSVLSLQPSAKVTAVSRHGRLPERFDPAAPPYAVGPYKGPMSVRGILRWLRAEIRMAGDWQSVFNAMRPRWDALWVELSFREQRRFLRHLWRRFERYRHRVPPQAADQIDAYLANGQLNVLAMDVKRIVADTSGGAVLVGKRGNLLSADLVVDCSGQSLRWGDSKDPLMRNVFRKAYAMVGPHGMGMTATPDGRIAPAFAHRIFAIGPMLRGARWETTAVPELRKQVAAVSDALLLEIGRVAQKATSTR